MGGAMSGSSSLFRAAARIPNSIAIASMADGGGAAVDAGGGGGPGGEQRSALKTSSRFLQLIVDDGSKSTQIIEYFLLDIITKLKFSFFVNGQPVRDCHFSWHNGK